ncbi:Ataxin-7-like protein 3 [Desmophyllum pertusum]|uniref:SAGA-associated factor 11 homolog n=1 Tax=Desmophyllum pertusum TaxID=174260 RepID=A0A9W9YVY2_9CNID|nr:Ataxin-7-like protein 3 [Desmophyllum pertusum]
MSSVLDNGSSPSEVDSLDLDEDSSPEFSIVSELIDEAIVSVCFDIHRSIKRGVYSVLEQSDEKIMKQFEVVECDGLDVFGQVPLKKQVECICPSCQRNMAANRFAPHLEKCLGMGRNSSRLASRRLATTGKLIDGDDDDDNYFDDDWTWNSDRKPGKKNKRDRGNSPRRAKAPRKNGEAGTPRPGTPSSVHSGELPATRTGLTMTAFEPLGNEEKKALLSQTCGVISEHTARMCTRSHRCPQHSDEQRQSVRLLLLGYAEVEPPVGRLRPDGSSLEPDDVIDVDSYEDGDGQALRDTLNRLSWEEESNVSTGDDNSPAAFGSVPLVKKKRKKKAKHKRRPR